MNSLNMFIAQILDIYMIIIVIRALLSWFAIQADSPFFGIYVFLIRITEPVLGWFRGQMRKIAPNMMFDISPIIVIVLLNIIKNLLLRA
ncbi:MAG: YggT family protein [Candidatus Cloacimonadales bacterium]|nr:YggT family protein [Candidatus Cloacimonadales bacterium]